MAIPVSLADARRQLRLEDDDESRDADLQQYIDDAAAWVERYTGHLLVAGDVTETFAAFDRLRLRAWPIKADATPLVEFADAAGAAIEVLGARLNTQRRPAEVLPALDTFWPSVGAGIVSVTVRAGYENGDTVPRNLRRAMLILIAAYDADREGGGLFAEAETSASRLCSTFRRRTV